MCLPTLDRVYYHMSNMARKIHQKNCEVCGTSFIGYNLSKYCSPQCWNKGKAVYKRNYESKKRNERLSLIALKGGKCERCGYCANSCALQFHHTDPKKRKFSISAKGLIGKSKKAIARELQNCVLLCANCHIETHHPDKAFVTNIRNCDIL